MQSRPYDAWRSIAPRVERPRTTIEEKVQLLEDKRRLEELINEYGFACDNQGWDVLEEIYDDDIEREIGGTLAEKVLGKHELIELHRNPVLPRAAGVDTVKADVTRFRNRELRHLISTKVIRVADDNQAAWALCYYQMAVIGQDDAGWQRGEHEGTYIFTFSRATGTWKFTQHLIWSNNAVNPMFAAPKANGAN